MIEYLIRSRTRRSLLTLLWRDGEQGTVSELARLAGVSFAAAHTELVAMARARLARRKGGSNARFVANLDHPDEALLRALFSSRVPPRGTTQQQPNDDEVVSWLKHLGAPLTGPAASAPPTPEVALAHGLQLARRDAAVARVLPICIARHRHRLDFVRLRWEARRLGEHQTLGFFFELTHALSGDRALLDEASVLRDRRFRKTRDFFLGSASQRARQLAELNTPQLARRWNFRMNMGLDSFETLFAKHEGGDAALRG